MNPFEEMSDAEIKRLVNLDMIDALERYINYGIPTGSFLRAVLAHDLFESFSRADIWNQQLMYNTVKYIYNHVPSICHGSYEKVDEWIANGGFNGMKKPLWDRKEGC
jgi:hypothetical protein